MDRVNFTHKSAHEAQRSQNVPSSVLHGETLRRCTGFSALQRQSLAAICDAFVPSVSYETSTTSAVEANGVEKESWMKNEEDEVQALYRLSASEAGVPAHAAGLMESTLKPFILRLFGWVLWMLSTRFGTFVLFGRASLSREFPYFQSFLELSTSHREQLLLNWSKSCITFYRLLFKAFKVFSVFAFYTKVDSKNHNPTWNAIGYCGPDPLAKAFRNEKQGKQRTPKPLQDMVIDVDTMKHTLPSALVNAGFAVFEDTSHLSGLWRRGQKSLIGGKAMGVKCDVVVVGSGSGGGVAAGVLAQAGFKVIVLEKGRYFARDDLSLLEGPSMEHLYENGGLLSTDDGTVFIQAGATVGGGSAINWSASFRTPAYILEEWGKSHNLSMFTTPKYQEAVDIVCARMGVQAEVENENLQNTILRKGCQKMGYHVDNAPRNCGANHFCGWCGYGCWSGRKQATSETWLVDATASGAIILTGCRARAVLHEHSGNACLKPRRAVGVVAALGKGPDLLFIESRATVIACGALKTPPLLLRSGFRNPNIGKNLHLHPVQMVWGYFPEGQGLKGNTYEGCTLTTISREVANLRSTGYGCILENPSLHPGVFAVMMPWLSGFDHKERMRRFARTVHIFALARDRGSGTADGKSLSYKLSMTDEENLMIGVEKALRVLIAAGATEVGTHHNDGDKLKMERAASAEIEDFLQRVQSKGLRKTCAPLGSAHQMGTCRMGINPRTSAVDPKGESWEAEGLFIADTSVFPTALGINPMVTVQAIAYCTAKSVVDYMRQL